MTFMDDIPSVSSSRNRRRKTSAAARAGIYRAVVCPVCGCDKCPVTSSPAPKKGDQFRLRYHKCVKCKHKFKSTQQINMQ